MIKMKTVPLGQRGQLVIPQEFREDLKLEEGEELVVFENGKEIMIRKQEKVIHAMEDSDFWHTAQEKTLQKIWEDEPDGLWESYLSEKGKKKLKSLLEKKKGKK
jgi:AbrB family looped-hinge helix DNA binding protein